MADQTKDQLRDSHYDGIQEYDNDLPRWWLGTFYITLVFGITYWLYFYVYGVGAGQQKELEMDLQAHQKLVAAKGGSEVTDEKLLALANDANAKSGGKQVFQSQCVACHGMNGEGGVGPNLTDSSWIHGGKPTAIYQTIVKGVPEKGMISWRGILTENQIQQSVVHILGLKGTNPANAKAAEGTVEP